MYIRKVVLYPIAIVIFGYMAYIIALQFFSYCNGSRYTIAITYGETKIARGRGIKYYYYVDDEKYESYSVHMYNSKFVNGRYWVKYAESQPDINNILQDRPVPACIGSLPVDGFEAIFNCQQFDQWKRSASSN